MEAWRLDALEGIRHTLARYVIATDSGHHEEFFGLFADDGEFVLPGGEVGVGPKGVQELLARKGELFKAIDWDWSPAWLRHNMTTQDIEILSETEARAEAYFMVCTDHGLDHWGRWIDRLTKHEDGRWLFARREVHTEASYPDSWFRNVFSKV